MKNIRVLKSNCCGYGECMKYLAKYYKEVGRIEINYGMNKEKCIIEID